MLIITQIQKPDAKRLYNRGVNKNSQEILKVNYCNFYFSGEEPKMLRLPRAREVGQSWVSSVFTTFNACMSAIALVYRNRPDLLVRLG